MNNKNNNHNDDSFSIKTVISRHIVIHENIFNALSPSAMQVYLTLRFAGDYSCDVSPVKRNVQFLCNKSKIKRSICFKALNELEAHGLLKRKSDPGYQSVYLIADKLGYLLTQDLAIDQPVHQTDGVVHQTDGVVQEVDTIINNSSSNSFHLNNIGISEETPLTGNVVVTKPPKLKPEKPKCTNKQMLELMLSNNPFGIGEDVLQDWLLVRNRKRAVVTNTAWKQLLEELYACDEAGLNPATCFKTMVGNGWQSLKVDWFKTNTSKSIDNNNTDYLSDHARQQFGF